MWSGQIVTVIPTTADYHL